LPCLAFVGWVEARCADTHHSFVCALMGIASLHPSYFPEPFRCRRSLLKTWAPALPLSSGQARRPYGLNRLNVLNKLNEGIFNLCRSNLQQLAAAN